MVRTGQYVIAALWLLASVSVSQADMGSADTALTIPAASPTVATASPSPSLPLDQQTNFLVSFEGLVQPEAAVGKNLPSTPLMGSGQQETINLTSEPDSVGLFLSALGTLGAWQLGRSSKKLHLGHLPDWYHAEGPRQIGHVLALELGLDGTILWDSGKGTFLPDRPAFSYRWDEGPPRLSAQGCQSSAQPRGPPWAV